MNQLKEKEDVQKAEGETEAQLEQGSELHPEEGIESSEQISELQHVHEDESSEKEQSEQCGLTPQSCNEHHSHSHSHRRASSEK